MYNFKANKKPFENSCKVNIKERNSNCELVNEYTVYVKEVDALMLITQNDLTEKEKAIELDHFLNGNFAVVAKGLKTAAVFSNNYKN